MSESDDLQAFEQPDDSPAAEDFEAATRETACSPLEAGVPTAVSMRRTRRGTVLTDVRTPASRVRHVPEASDRFDAAAPFRSAASNSPIKVQPIKTQTDSSAWSIPLLCIGVAIIACCVLVPAADENHRLIAENQRLQADLAQIKKQIAVNDDFLKSVADNPTLLERLAQRQMKMVHSGESVLKIKDPSGSAGQLSAQMSPFLLLNLPPPAMATEGALPPGDVMARLEHHLGDQPRIRLMAMGGALLLMATALVLGAAPQRVDD